MIAVADRGSMFDPSPVFYMDKIVTGHEGHGVVDLARPIGDNIRALAGATGKERFLACSWSAMSAGFGSKSVTATNNAGGALQPAPTPSGAAAIAHPRVSHPVNRFGGSLG